MHKLLPYILPCMNDQSAIHMSRNFVFDDENKYIEGDSNFLQEKMQDEAIITYRVKSVEQLTDSRSQAFSNSLCISGNDEFCPIHIHKLKSY